MIAEIVVSCAISAGSTFSPPEGWRVTQVAFQGFDNPCNGGICLAVHRAPIESNTVTLSRQAKVGERVTAPPGCGQVEVQAK